MDAFVTKINSAGSALVYSTTLGGFSNPSQGGANEVAYGIAIDSLGNAYVAGVSNAPDFPVTSDSYQPFNRGFSDAFVSKVGISFVISGLVLDGSSAPVSGAEVVLTDGTSLTTVLSEFDGYYEFIRLREGGSFTVTATKPHFTMAPTSQTFNNLTSNQTQNFIATATGAPFYTISGQVAEAGELRSVMTLSGSQPGTRTTDNNGNYSFELAGGGNYTVTPARFGFTFTPPNQTFNNLSAAQSANFVANRQNFVVTTTNRHGPGSLREAILIANANGGKDTVVFNIPGPGVKTITVATALPEITDQIVIDATTQPGYAGSPLVELNGLGLGGSA